MAGHHRRREPFPPDRGLQLRMVLTAIGTPLLVLACLAALVALAPAKILIGVAIAAVVGIVAAVHERSERPAPRVAGPEDEPLLHGIVSRLCVLADLPQPEIVVEDEREPNSWLVGLRRGRSRLHVTRGLLALLEPAELEAVVAHELAHLAHRDAAVMTAVGGPGAVLLGGGRHMNGGFIWLSFGFFVAAGIGWLSRLGTQALSRHRELAADAGAAALTGRPTALTTALRKVSGQLRVVPREDLRVAAARDAFNLLPAEVPAGGLKGRLLGTHPPLAVRLERLERLEQTLQRSRLAGPADG
jgi:heat shock protein HtpX